LADDDAKPCDDDPAEAARRLRVNGFVVVRAVEYGHAVHAMRKTFLADCGAFPQFRPTARIGGRTVLAGALNADGTGVSVPTVTPDGAMHLANPQSFHCDGARTVRRDVYRDTVRPILQAAHTDAATGLPVPVLVQVMFAPMVLFHAPPPGTPLHWCPNPLVPAGEPHAPGPTLVRGLLPCHTVSVGVVAGSHTRLYPKTVRSARPTDTAEPAGRTTLVEVVAGHVLLYHHALMTTRPTANMVGYEVAYRVQPAHAPDTPAWLATCGATSLSLANPVLLPPTQHGVSGLFSSPRFMRTGLAERWAAQVLSTDALPVVAGPAACCPATAAGCAVSLVERAAHEDPAGCDPDAAWLRRWADYSDTDRAIMLPHPLIGVDLPAATPEVMFAHLPSMPQLLPFLHMVAAANMRCAAHMVAPTDGSHVARPDGGRKRVRRTANPAVVVDPGAYADHLARLVASTTAVLEQAQRGLARLCAQKTHGTPPI
jgi:hypothetical protein